MSARTTVISFGDAAEKAIAKRKRLATLVVKDDSTSTITFSDSGWDMSFNAINTQEKLLKAIYYLNDKNWFTKDHLKSLLIMWQKFFGKGIDLSSFNAHPA